METEFVRQYYIPTDSFGHDHKATCPQQPFDLQAVFVVVNP